MITVYSVYILCDNKGLLAFEKQRETSCCWILEGFKNNDDDEIDKENIQPENLSAKEPLFPKFSSQRNNRSCLKDNKGSMDSFKTSDSKSVYVSNLEYSVSKDMLTNYFEKVGPI